MKALSFFLSGLERVKYFFVAWQYFNRCQLMNSPPESESRPITLKGRDSSISFNDCRVVSSPLLNWQYCSLLPEAISAVSTAKASLAALITAILERRGLYPFR